MTGRAGRAPSHVASVVGVGSGLQQGFDAVRVSIRGGEHEGAAICGGVFAKIRACFDKLRGAVGVPVFSGPKKRALVVADGVERRAGRDEEFEALQMSIHGCQRAKVVGFVVGVGQIASALDEEGQKIGVSMKCGKHGGASAQVVGLLDVLAVDVENPGNALNVAMDGGFEKVGECGCHLLILTD